MSCMYTHYIDNVNTTNNSDTESAVTINYKLAYEKEIAAKCKKVIEQILTDINSNSIKTFYFVANEQILLNFNGKNSTVDIAGDFAKLYINEFKKLGLQMFNMSYTLKSDNNGRANTYEFYVRVDTNEVNI
jgi:hypothetical protein